MHDTSISQPNWPLLFEEFIASECSVADFLRRKNISPTSGSSKRATRGWTYHRGTIRRQMAEEARLKTLQIGRDAITVADRQLFAVLPGVIPSLIAYMGHKRRLTPQECKVILELAWSRVPEVTMTAESRRQSTMYGTEVEEMLRATYKT